MTLPPLPDAKTEQFEVPTRDGRTKLTGQIDLPIGNAALHPVVLMVNGGRGSANVTDTWVRLGLKESL